MNCIAEDRVDVQVSFFSVGVTYRCGSRMVAYVDSRRCIFVRAYVCICVCVYMSACAVRTSFRLFLRLPDSLRGDGERKHRKVFAAFK